ncbi:MAG: BON domain-containing protein [Armatimonadetes bacterium]|nr:BON domain-containing protein [Armatimonadota bacterium]
MTKLLSIVFAGVLTVGLMGCNETDAKDLSNDTGKLLETAGRSALNASVAAKVSTALALRKNVDITKLRVEAVGDTVTISGSAPDSKAKRLILEIARETKGVGKVVDKIEIRA